MGRNRTQSPNKQLFYLVHDRGRETASGSKFLNRNEVCAGSGSEFVTPVSPSERGFRPYTVRPRVLISKRLGRRVPDFETWNSYWFISDAGKRLLDAVCPGDVTYLPVDVEVDPGVEPMIYWLCDVVTIIDAINEARSERLMTSNILGTKYHTLTYSSTVFDEDAVGNHNLFRLTTSPLQLVCTQRFRDAYKAAKLSGQTFRPAYDPPFETTGTITSYGPVGRSKLKYGNITPDGRGAKIFFTPKAFDDPNETPIIGQRVSVRGHRDKYGGRVADHVVKL